MSSTTFAPLRHGAYRRWASADLVSITGTWMGTLALGWVILERGGSALGLGVTILATTLPALIIGPFAGAFVDRRHPRRMVLITQVARMLAACLVAFAVTADWSIPHIQALALLVGCVTVFDGPALTRLGTYLVDPEVLPSCVAFGSVVNSAGRIVGMTAGGALAALLGASTVLWLDAASFLVVIAVVATITVRTTAGTREGIVDPGVRAGLRALAARRRIVGVLSLAFVLGGIGRNFQVTMLAMSAGPLHGGSGGYGVLSAAFAIGALAGGVLSTRLRNGRLRVLLLAAAGAAALQAVSGIAPSVMFFGLLLLVIGGLAVIVDTSVMTHVVLGMPEEARGRAAAALGTVSAAAAGTGALALGWLCDCLGPRGALTLAGAVTLTCCLAAAATVSRHQRPSVRLAMH